MSRYTTIYLNITIRPDKVDECRKALEWNRKVVGTWFDRVKGLDLEVSGKYVYVSGPDDCSIKDFDEFQEQFCYWLAKFATKDSYIDCIEEDGSPYRIYFGGDGSWAVVSPVYINPFEQFFPKMEAAPLYHKEVFHARKRVGVRNKKK
jgi:hypothetical protein